MKIQENDEIHIHVWVSRVVSEALFGQKSPEMNDSDPYLFKTSKNFKNGSVFLKLQLVKNGNYINIWVKSGFSHAAHLLYGRVLVNRWGKFRKFCFD